MNKVSKMKAVPDPEAPAQADGGPETRAEPAPKRKRRGGRFLLMLLVPLALLAGGGWIWLSGGRFEATDNANLREATLNVVSDLSGRVTEVAVANNAVVAQGDTLFTVDPEPYRLAVSEAETAVANARLGVEQMKAAYRQALAQQQAAKDELDYQQSELERQSALTDRGVSTTATLDQAKHAVRKAQEQFTAAQQATQSALAALGGDPDAPTDRHPRVQAALSTLDRARYDLSRTTVRAPAAGRIYQAESFHAGQFVAAGTPLFSLVETGDLWVDANFKETQLTNIREGQPAEVSFDILPGQSFAATVEAIGAGTGAEFSLLPAQNATGNWVKVTQRVPVRLRLTEPAPEAARISGASASVSVDTGVSRHLPGLDLAFLN